MLVIVCWSTYPGSELRHSGVYRQCILMFLRPCLFPSRYSFKGVIEEQDSVALVPSEYIKSTLPALAATSL